MILHIFPDDKFAPEYIGLINENFDQSVHLFLVLSYMKLTKYVSIGDYPNVKILKKNFKDIYYLMHMIKVADKIVLHGLFSKIAMFLLVVCGASPRTICALWGGDLYSYGKEKKYIHLIKRYILTHAKGIAMELEDDYKLAQKWYGAKTRYFHTFLYMSNIVREKYSYVARKEGMPLRIQIGNSADPSNRHVEVLNKLKGYADKNIEIVIPLSYGDKEYAEKVTCVANGLFRHKVSILKEFMPIDKYLKFLNTIDIAIFAHKRQQGLGNIVSLISMGKKVYVPSDVTVYHSLSEQGIRLFKTESIKETMLEKINPYDAKTNIELITKMCSKEQLIKDWIEIFNS